jgi:subtilisin family serine protease
MPQSVSRIVFDTNLTQGSPGIPGWQVIQTNVVDSITVNGVTTKVTNSSQLAGISVNSSALGAVMKSNNVYVLSRIAPKWPIGVTTMTDRKSGAVSTVADLSKYFKVRFGSARDVRSVVAALKGVAGLSHEFAVIRPHHFSFPSDTLFPDQWYLSHLKVPLAWASFHTYDLAGAGTRIGIIDDGVYDEFRLTLHDDIAAKLDRVTTNYSSNPHGVMVSSVAAAQTDNVKGMAGTSPKGRLWMYGADWDPIEEISASIFDSLDVMSMSWGIAKYPPYDTAQGWLDAVAVLYDLLYALRSSGTLLFAAAGNDQGGGTPFPFTVYPQHFNDIVLSVGATDSTGARTSWSNYGCPSCSPPVEAFVDFVAPGVNVVAATMDANWLFYQYAPVSGTSFSSPMTAGVASLGMSMRNTLAGNTIEARMRSTAIFNTGDDALKIGSGRVDANKFIQRICCVVNRGNVDNDPSQSVDIGDLTEMVDRMFTSLLPYRCHEEANVDGSSDGIVDISDLTYMVNFLYMNGPAPVGCPF